MANKNKIISQAQKYITKGQWDKAVKELQKLVAEDPNDVRTLLKLGDVYSKKGDRENATKVYKQVAESYSDQGFFLKAVAVYKQILKHDPKHLQVTLKLAELYEHLGLTSEAMAQYHRASQIQEELGRSKETLEVLKRMVELDAENVASRIKLAESFSRENMLPEAIGEFERAADILRKQNRVDDYIKVAERLVYHDQSRLDVIKELARLYLDRGDAKRGLAKLQICFKAQPRDIDVLKMLSQAFTSLGQHQKTIFVFKELARVYQEEGRAADAAEVLQQILQLDPNDPDARGLLGGEPPRTSSPGPVSPPFLAPVMSPTPPPPAPPPSLSPRPGSIAPLPQANEWSVPSQPGYPFGASPAPTLAPSLEPRPGSRTRQPSLAPRPPPPPPPGDDDTRGGSSKPGRKPPPRDASREGGQIAKILTETDVYIKYGLREKALSHLRRVFELDSDNVDAYGKMREIYRSMGDHARAAEAIANIMHVHNRRGETKLLEAARAELAKLVPGHPLVNAGIPGSLPGPLSHSEVSDEISVDIDEDHADVFELVDEFPGRPVDEELLDDEPLDVDGSSVSLAIRSSDLLEMAHADEGRLIEDLETPTLLPDEDLPEANSGLIMLSDVETGAEIDEGRPSFALDEDEDDDEPVAAPVHDEVDPFAGNERSEITARNSLDDARREVTDRSDIKDLLPPAPAAIRRDVTLRREIEEPVFSDDDTDTNSSEPLAEGSKGLSLDLIGDFGEIMHTIEEPAIEDDATADELDEAEFLIEAGLAQEAREAVQSILSRIPMHERALEMLSRVEALEREVNADTDHEDDEDELTDSSEQLPLDHLPLPEDDGTSAGDRYDQGMLFKEIGRVDDAIREFRGAARQPERELQSLEMIGHCLLEKGTPKDAVAYFARALDRGADGISAINLKYEIGNGYEAAGELESALQWFTACLDEDPDHRDVRDRVERLSSPHPPGGNGAQKQNGVPAESPKVSSSKKSKISYI